MSTVTEPVVARASFSEMSTLAACEKQWWYRYVLKEKRPPSDAMYLGTAFHEFADEWWDGASVDLALGRIDTSNMTYDDVKRLEWLALRYDSQYADDRNSGRVKIVGTDIKMTATLPGTDITIVGYFDFLALVDGLLYLGERKTMYDWSRLDTLDVDLQVSDYVWLARANGLPVQGIAYDAIRTYQWKPDRPTQTALMEQEANHYVAMKGVEPHPWEGDPAFDGMPTGKARKAWAKREQERHLGVDRAPWESFQWLSLLRTDEQIDEAELEMQTVLRRRAVLLDGERPMRNIGMACKRCPFREDCFESMAFPPYELELDLSDA